MKFSYFTFLNSTNIRSWFVIYYSTDKKSKKKTPLWSVVNDSRQFKFMMTVFFSMNFVTCNYCNKNESNVERNTRNFVKRILKMMKNFDEHFFLDNLTLTFAMITCHFFTPILSHRNKFAFYLFFKSILPI